MKKIICLFSLLLSLNSYGLDILTHFSNDSEAGVSIEQSIINYKKIELGIGGTWNEINEDDYNRTFPVYFVGRYDTTRKFYAVGRAGITLDDSFENDSKFLESGIGINYSDVIIELLASHQRQDNQLVFKFGYKIK